jgi:hypothetical protein
LGEFTQMLGPIRVLRELAEANSLRRNSVRRRGLLKKGERDGTP